MVKMLKMSKINQKNINLLMKYTGNLNYYER